MHHSRSKTCHRNVRTYPCTRRRLRTAKPVLPCFLGLGSFVLLILLLCCPLWCMVLMCLVALAVAAWLWLNHC